MPERPLKSLPPAVRLCLLAAALGAAGSAAADAGPPFLSNDPGTPGNGNWEINIAAMQTTLPGVSSWQLPQLDVNYGLGDRIQLTVEIPYLVGSTSSEGQVSGWGNAYPGVKWRFFDQGEGGWQIATFPQLQTAGSTATQRAGLSLDGPRLLRRSRWPALWASTPSTSKSGTTFPAMDRKSASSVSSPGDA